MTDFSTFVKRIIADYRDYAHIVNEGENISSLCFILCSKEYRRNLRLHSIVQNLSGAGKTTLLDAVIRPFKLVCREDVIEISRFTGPALQRYGSFDGKTTMTVRRLLHHTLDEVHLALSRCEREIKHASALHFCRSPESRREGDRERDELNTRLRS